ncbi:MAG TPA: triose-phosphate isomerase [Gammaproteobacteria bacterium]|nr:triose-phosphate isomerase [Gammaproteobacteria bacterium]
MRRRMLVVGNWKMHGSIAFAVDLAKTVVDASCNFASMDIAICPPHVLLGVVGTQLGGSEVALGAQTVSEFAEGAYTGETAASMLAELGCKFVIVGHSERRHLFGETNDIVAAKAAMALAAGMTPIICVGERLEDRKNGTTRTVIGEQLRPFMEPPGIDTLRQAVIAYEPVWAIGTGETATPKEAQDVHNFIRSSIAVVDKSISDTIRILYGGSVKPDNAPDLFRMTDIDGSLVGGASLKADDFLLICGSTQPN